MFDGAGFFQDAIGLVGERIGRVAIGEGKIVGGKEMLVVLIVGARWRSEAMVEEAEAAAGDMRNDAVEHAAGRFVGVEAVPKKMAQAAAALRGAKADGAD